MPPQAPPTVVSDEAAGVVNPLDLIEQVLDSRECFYERPDGQSINLLFKGEHCDLQVNYAWLPLMEVLNISCSFDLKVQDYRRVEVQSLIARINGCQWVGHFDLWEKEGIVMYRHALLISDVEVAVEQSELLVPMLIEACNTFYPAFQFVVWAGRTAQEAMEAVMVETEGEA